jgi:hypothetical protein
MREWRYNSMHSFSQHLMEVSAEPFTQATLDLRKEPPVFIDYGAGWASELVWRRFYRKENLLRPPGIIP